MQTVKVVLHNQLLIEVCSPEKITSGGIILPDTAIRKQDKGVVVKAGIGTPKNPMKIPEGATVYTVKGYATKTPVEHDNKICYLIQEHEVLTWIPPENN